MKNEIITPTHQPTARGWPQAYVAFLLSPTESLVLKIAPLALLIGTPEVIASNFLPVVGEISDLTELVLVGIVVVRTLAAVRRYIKRD